MLEFDVLDVGGGGGAAGGDIRERRIRRASCVWRSRRGKGEDEGRVGEKENMSKREIGMNTIQGYMHEFFWGKHIHIYVFYRTN